MGFIEEQKKQREEDAAEVERLRSILEKLGVKEKLGRIKEKVWKEGSMSETSGYEEWIKGNVAELRLVANYPDFISRESFRTVADIFYPRGRLIYSGKEYLDAISVAVLFVGAASVNPTVAVSKGDGISGVGDYVYVGFRTTDLPEWTLGKYLSSFGRYNRKLGINDSVTDLEVSKFVDERLLEFTSSKFLPRVLGGRP